MVLKDVLFILILGITEFGPGKGGMMSEQKVSLIKYILKYRLKEVLAILLFIAIMIIIFSLKIKCERNPQTGRMELQTIEKPQINLKDK